MSVSATVGGSYAGDYDLPRSVRLVAWGGAALRGEVSLDDAVDRIVAADTVHRVIALPQEPDEAGLALALGRLRASGVHGLRLVLPAPGDAAGLAGPPDVNALAIAAGQVVYTAAAPYYAVVPSTAALGSSGLAVRWSVHVALPPSTTELPGVAEAERELAQAMREATDVLDRLDVARFDADAHEALRRLRSGEAAEDALAPGYPARAYRVLSLAVRVAGIAALAQASIGAALTGVEIRARSEALRPLDRAARRAIAAAVNAPLEPRRD